ncbi:protein-lysine N-methyltransferase Efm2p [Monosporozyma servazzii]
MFDPLDLYDSPVVGVTNNVVAPYVTIGTSKVEVDNIKTPVEDDEEDIPITVLDLPTIRYATPNVILTVLRLLRSDNQLNFKSDSDCSVKIESAEEIEAYCSKKEISKVCQAEIVDWYANKWPNSLLNTLSKIINKIPNLKTTESTDKLLSYYTSIIRYCEQHSYTTEKDVTILEMILKEASLRISESCGRTAFPSMHRDFQFNNLRTVIKLFEPSMTADNLGWKTWGASMVLSQTLVEDDKHFDFSSLVDLKKQGKLRVLELGSGTGLVGIAWAMKWKELQENNTNSDSKLDVEIYLTDLPDIVDNLKKNVTNNNLDGWAFADVLDWTDPSSFIEKYGADKFDVILVADPIYSPDHPRWVVNMMDKFLKEDGICHFQIPIRNKYARERELLIELLEENKFAIIDSKYEEGNDDWGLVKYLYRKIIRKK